MKNCEKKMKMQYATDWKIIKKIKPEMLRTPRRNSILITYFDSERVKMIRLWTG